MLAGSLVVRASRVHSAAGTATPQRADIGEKVYFSDLMGWRIWYPVSGIWVGGRNVQTFNVITLWGGSGIWVGIEH